MHFSKKESTFGKTFVRLELDGLNIPELVSGDKASLLDFHFDTYKALSKKSSNPQEDQEAWDKVFGVVHKFMDNKWSDGARQKFVMTLAAMHYRTVSTMHEIVTRRQQSANTIGEATFSKSDGVLICELENVLSGIMAAFDKEVNLYPSLVDFIESGQVPIHSCVGAGERAQDTPEMTWYRPDVVKLTAIVLLCKMFTPIFGVFMSYFKQKTGELDNAYKEIHSVAILKDTIASRCPEINDKLEIYLTRTITQVTSKDEDLTRIYNGCTDNAIYHFIYAQLLTRRFVLVDLCCKGSNLMTYITCCIREAVNTQFSNSNFKSAARTFTYPNEASSEEDGNLSNLEVESRFSNKTADYELLVRAAAIQTLDTFTYNHELDKDILAAASVYYTTQNHIDLTNYCSYMMGIVFGPSLCGARSIEMLNATDTAKLVSVLQYYLIKQKYADLAIAVTAKPTGEHRDFVSGQDVVLRNNWKASYDFKNCAAKFQIEMPTFKWSTGLEKAINSFINEVHLINLAPVFWDLLEQESRNGEIYSPDGTFARDTCAFIRYHYLA